MPRLILQIGESCGTPEDLADLLEQIAKGLRRADVTRTIDRHGIFQSVYPMWTLTEDASAPTYPRT